MITDKSQLKQGTQIIYVPDHAEGLLTHPDCEHGFVWSKGVTDGQCWCRYWMPTEWGRLRTVSCSESTLLRNLVITDTGPQDIVDATIRKLVKPFIVVGTKTGRISSNV